MILTPQLARIFAVIFCIVDSSIEEKLYVKTAVLDSNNNTITSELQVKVNTSANSVEFFYREDDDALKSWTVLYSENVQVFKSINLGEVVLKQPVYRFHCFIMFYDASKITPLKVIMNMDQEHFDDIQKADVQLNPKAYAFDVIVPRDKLELFGEGIYQSCREANLILTNMEEIRKISKSLKLTDLTSAILSHASALSMYQYPLCEQANPHSDMKCRCKTNVFVDWYPCSPKLCEKYNALLDDEDNVPYACGVSSCMQRHQFVYLVEKLHHCLAD